MTSRVSGERAMDNDTIQILKLVSRHAFGVASMAPLDLIKKLTLELTLHAHLHHTNIYTRTLRSLCTTFWL